MMRLHGTMPFFLNALIYLACCVCLLPPQAPAQTDPSQKVPEKFPALRVTTRLVVVNVVVRDKKGGPVAGLTRDDFRLLDRGQAQTIATFSEENEKLSPPPSPLPPNVFTNRFGQVPGQAGPGNVSILLFDALNTQLKDQAYARQQMLKLLRQLQPQDHVAIYLLTTQLSVLQEFTDDSTALVRALNNFKGYSSAALDASTPQSSPYAEGLASDVSTTSAPGPTDAGLSNLADFLSSAERQLSQFATINRIETTTVALEAIANHVASVPGRKSLIWVSGSFPVSIGMDAESLADATNQSRAFGPEIERAARVLNQANIAVYPVDARGLVGMSQFRATTRGNTKLSGPVVPAGGTAVDTSYYSTMNTFAQRTGGLAYYNTNDIAGSFRQALSDGQLSYAIAYYPNHGKWDGSFHEIKLEVKRPGIHLRYRKGYFATETTANDQAERKVALNDAVLSPLDSTAMSLRVTVRPAAPASPRLLGLEMAIDPHELLLNDVDGRRKGGVEIVLVQEDDNSKILASDDEPLAIDLKPEQYQSLLKTGVGFSLHIQIRPGTSVLKVIVRDAATGTIGSVKIPLKRYLPA